jgi:SpoIID/LytB domain protein
LGKVYEAEGLIDAAIENYQRVIKEDSHFIEVRPLLGPLFEKKKQPDDAWRQYARISWADPGNLQARSGMARLTGKITKKPEEILPPKVIERHTEVPAIDRTDVPMVRVGIGTDGSGRPTSKKTVSFRTAHPFVVMIASTGIEIARGQEKMGYSVKVNSSGRFASLFDAGGILVSSFTSAILITQPGIESPTTIVNSLSYAPGSTWGGMADKELRGELEITFDKKNKRLIIVNRVSLEEYVSGVLAAEMPVHWPLEALKAQAVVIRTLAVYRTRYLKLHRKGGYDLCDEQHCQVYTGVGVESDKVRSAVNETRGQIVVYDGIPAHAVFSSNCGGLTQSGPQAGWGDVAYWKSVSDVKAEAAAPTSPWELREWLRDNSNVYCRASQYVWAPESRWTRVVPAEVISRRLGKKGLGRVKQIKILKRNATGRVGKILVVGSKKSITISKEHEIRKYLGLGLLRSTLFTVERTIRDDQAQYFVFYGGGWGHGVGFCQSGAAGRAETGQTYKDILDAYLPKTVLKSAFR